MPVRLSVVETTVSPSCRVFWLHARAPAYLDDMREAGRRASEADAGFAGSAVGVATQDPDRVRVRVEVWTARPLLLGDEEPFGYAVEGEVELATGQWCIDESRDWQIQNGTPLPRGAGRYGVRVTAYREPGERYRLQLWAQRRRR